MGMAAMALAPARMSSMGRFSASPLCARKPRIARQSVFFTSRCHIDAKHQAEKSVYKRELEAAIEVVERACRLCTSVQAGLRPDTNKHTQQSMKFEKSDATPVTVADLGVQALVSLELGLQFPAIPLMGEEDSRQLREDLCSFEKSTGNAQDRQPLVKMVRQVVSSVASENFKGVTTESILSALDRGVKSISDADHARVSYWILDPIDGTRGFLKGGDALYVVGLALVVDGEVVLGVMGCPNIRFKYSDKATSRAAFALQMVTAQQQQQQPSQESQNPDECCNAVQVPVPRGFQAGLVMAAASGCGCWLKVLSNQTKSKHTNFEDMIESKVDGYTSAMEATFCISDNEEWTTLPLAQALTSVAADKDWLERSEAQILPLCCGSLCKYFAVALGGASVFVQHIQEAKEVKVWDHAAGVICVVEAGGQVTDFQGSLVQKILGNGQQAVAPRGGVIVSNGHLHDLILTSLSSSEVPSR